MPIFYQFLGQNLKNLLSYNQFSDYFMVKTVEHEGGCLGHFCFKWQKNCFFRGFD